MGPRTRRTATGRNERGQASTIGVALLFGLTIISATIIVAFGAVALEDTQQQAETNQAEHAMTQFDSRAAEVALSETSVQSVRFGQQGGSYEVDPSAGRITVTHANFNGGSDDDGNSVDDGNSDDDEAVYTGTLGAVIYKNGDTKLAYQGGGVWRKDKFGGSTMVSPPEFHYRDGTLTFPVIRTDGSGGASGAVTATIKRDPNTVQHFPDASRNYNDGNSPNKPYLNPTSKGTVLVTVESEYYQGWAQYFRARTDGTVTVDDANEEVTVELKTIGLTGPFPVPNDQSNGGGSLTVRGIEPGHTLQSFRFTIIGKENQNSRFKNLRWSMYVDEGNQHFEIALGGGSNVDCGTNVKPIIYYSPDGGNTFQAWKATTGYPVTCINPDGDSKENAKVTIDLIGNSQSFDYVGVSGSELTHFKNNVGTFDDGNSEDLHSDAAHGSLTVEDGGTNDPKQSSWLIKHYYDQLGPEFDIKVRDEQGGNAAGVAESNPDSDGYIDYPGGDQVVKYLHVSKNRIVVEFD